MDMFHIKICISALSENKNKNKMQRSRNTGSAFLCGRHPHGGSVLQLLAPLVCACQLLLLHSLSVSNWG